MRSGEQEPGKYQGAWSIRRLTPRVARWIRIFTGDDDQSHFSVSEIEWNDTQALNAISKSEQAKTISCEETAEGASPGLAQRPASPVRDHSERAARVGDAYRREASSRTRRYLTGRRHFGRRTSLAPGRPSTVASCRRHRKLIAASNVKGGSVDERAR